MRLRSWIGFLEMIDIHGNILRLQAYRQDTGGMCQDDGDPMRQQDRNGILLN